MVIAEMHYSWDEQDFAYYIVFPHQEKYRAVVGAALEELFKEDRSVSVTRVLTVGQFLESLEPSDKVARAVQKAVQQEQSDERVQALLRSTQKRLQAKKRTLEDEEMDEIIEGPFD